MRNSDRHRTQRIDGLRLSIDCLPESTREAMLDGLRANSRIIVGAYVDDHGGVCPMLAAHRCGGRTDFLAFAKSWDRFTRAGGSPREATERELDILVRLLESSLEQEGSSTDLTAAIAEHRELCSRRPPSRQGLPAEADPAGEISVRRLLRRSAARLFGVRLAGVDDGQAQRPPVAADA
jgi:hypothetical protein